MIEHCCAEMTLQADRRCGAHPDVFACPDALVRFEPKFLEYGLIVHDGGSACREIAFCPWCGARLPESRRDRWFDTLEARGIDPWEDDVPPEFEDGRWLREDPTGLASTGEDAPRAR
ncbi:DUF6980 family protein [Streptomyces sp. NPDC060000]|uniref:DUF6980 family protein n=1 Tax=Streptomyces sp. NPDC060000 TaxID=3347031 RepID=UPI0036C2A7A9